MWTAAHVGKPFDSFRSQACDEVGREFLRKHHFPQSATFSLAAYGEGACAIVARFWVARMSFLLDLVEESGELGEKVSPEALASWEEPE
eukprot:4625545-Alexandrium_andersonii.AAC.1